MRGRWRRFRRHRNWLLHFNGASIASWLPTFSVELHDDGLIGQDIADLHRGVGQTHTHTHTQFYFMFNILSIGTTGPHHVPSRSSPSHHTRPGRYTLNINHCRTHFKQCHLYSWNIRNTTFDFYNSYHIHTRHTLTVTRVTNPTSTPPKHVRRYVTYGVYYSCPIWT